MPTFGFRCTEILYQKRRLNYEVNLGRNVQPQGEEKSMSHAATSIAALKTSPISSMRERVYEIIEAAGSVGCISDEVFDAFVGLENTNTGRVTGRYSELENEGRIVRLGDTRVGKSGKQQLVMRTFDNAAGAVKPKKKVTKTGFLAGLMFAARILISASDLLEAKAALKKELIKAAKR